MFLVIELSKTAEPRPTIATHVSDNVKEMVKLGKAFVFDGKTNQQMTVLGTNVVAWRTMPFRGDE